MRAVIQRVLQACVKVEGRVTGEIERGLLVFLGVGKHDETADVDWMVDKIVSLRIFPDENDRMNRSVRDVGGGVLLISQFTLYGNCRKGTRPSFDAAADPKTANGLYEYALEQFRKTEIETQAGVFAASMRIACVNDGPVTLVVDSKVPR